MLKQESRGAATPVPRARKDLVLQEVGEEGLLYDREGAMVHILNRTALHAWRLCDGRHTIDEIVEELVSAFRGAEASSVRRDVEKMLTALLDRGLLEQG